MQDYLYPPKKNKIQPKIWDFVIRSVFPNNGLPQTKYLVEHAKSSQTINV